MDEGTPLLRAQAGNRLEGSNPFLSATCPRESVLPIRMRPDFSVVFEGYAGKLNVGCGLQELLVVAIKVGLHVICLAKEAEDRSYVRVPAR